MSLIASSQYFLLPKANILQAPLSLIATIFGLVELPEDLHLYYVIKSMLVASVAVTTPLAGVVFYISRFKLTNMLLVMQNRARKRRWTERTGWSGRLSDVLKETVKIERGGALADVRY